MDDMEIIKLYNARDENAIRQTEKKYQSYLMKIALNILRSSEDSRECVNDTYFKAWDTIPPHQPIKLWGYLGKITHDISVDRFRCMNADKRRLSEYSLSLDELTDCLPSNENAYEYTEIKLLAELISRFLDRQSELERQVFIWRYYFCDSIRSIAQYSQSSESKITSMLYRTRKELKTHLEREGYSI